MAIIYEEIKDYDQAISLYDESLKIKKDLGDKYGIALTLLNKGRIFINKGDYDQAISLYDESLKIKI